MVAQWLPAPMVLPYVPHLIVLVPAAALVWGCADSAFELVPRTWLVPPVVWTRAFLLGVAPWAPWVFGAATTSFVTAARLASDGAGGMPIAFSGTVAAGTLLTGVLVQPPARRLGHRDAALLPVTGLVLCAVGLVLTAGVAGDDGSRGQLLLIVPVALLLGAAYGILLIAGLLAVERLVPPAELAGTVAVFYVLIYLGFAAPYVLTLLSGGTRYVPWLMGGAAVALLTVPVVVATAAVEGRRRSSADAVR
ncbi:putative membrane protein [Candidatus Protofrankia californiensis]|uniref:Putative membrane protein n=1 Tax=Candidatus Protofrankia californiensis TaxID=1839754 RepID=A0A1C3NZF3_9ACTN|nr:putative membrane protein [Candidatus Protofrankia californiensis]